MTDDKQKCVVYARYSSHAQKDTSIEDQVRDIEAYCKLNNLDIVKVYADRHLSGTTDQRPQFQQLMRDSAHGGWAYVVVWKTDRFARNRYDSATYKYRLKRYGIRVLSAKESIPDGPEGILLESVLEGSAEYYSANLAQNIRRGMHSNALECKVNSGAVPLGYRKGSDGRFEIVDSEANVVREIFSKVAEGVPYADICRDLNARKIKTKRGSPWGANSFHSLLKNEAYIGVYHFGDVRVEGGTPVIVDEDLFRKVADRLRASKHPHGKHRENGDYMLTGKLYCGLCGSPMVGVSGKGRHGGVYYYYVCNDRRIRHTCNKENVSREWLEQTVVDMTLQAVLRPDVIEWIADRVMEYQKKEANSAHLRSLQDELKNKQKAAANVMKAIEAGIITPTTKKRLEELERECVELEDAVALAKASITHIEREFVVYWLNSFRDGERDDKDFRRKVIDTFVAAIYLWDDRIRIAFNYTGDSKNTVDRDIVANAENFAPPEGSLEFSYRPPQECQANPATIFFVGAVFVLTVSLPKKRR